jgi:hypothetical protein
MSSRNSPTLTLDVRARRVEPCAAALVLVGGACGALLAGATFWPASWTNILAAAGCLAVIGSGLWRAGWIGSRHRIVELRWLADGRWVLTGNREAACPVQLSGELCAGTRLGRNALWLVWRTPRGPRRSLLLAPGDLPASQLRALSVRLRTEAVERALPEARGR